MSEESWLMISMIGGVHNCRMAWGPFKNYCCLFISNDLCTFSDCNLLDKSFLCDWCLSAHVGIYLIDCHKNNNSKKLLINMITGIFLPLTSFVQPAKKLIKLIQILICSFSSNKRDNLEWSMYIVHMVFHMSPNNYGWSVIQWSKFHLLANLVILYHIDVVWKTRLRPRMW